MTSRQSKALLVVRESNEGKTAPCYKTEEIIWVKQMAMRRKTHLDPCERVPLVQGLYVATVHVAVDVRCEQLFEGLELVLFFDEGQVMASTKCLRHGQNEVPTKNLHLCAQQQGGRHSRNERAPVPQVVEEIGGVGLHRMRV